MQQAADIWEHMERIPDGPAWLGRNDRFYLLARLLGRADVVHPWIYARCREVEASPDGHLDLWSREHYKSTVITYAGIIQEVLRDPEITVGIFSHTKPIARGFLLQIKREMESNERLRATYPDVLWADPSKESPSWSEEKGITVRRKSNPKESTIEAHGLVDGMPTGKHFRLMVYDDVVTRESVSTPDQVAKTTEAWALSDNLGARGPDGNMRKWYIGTRYSFADTYAAIMEKGAAKPRIYPATDDGTINGKPVLLTPEAWALKKRDQTSAVLAAQMLQNPAAGNEAMFKKEWLRFSDIRPATLNVYIMVDPASSKKRQSDRTAMAVVGVDAAGNRYLLDGFAHKMSLSERWTNMKGLRMAWMRMPGVQSVSVGYERYGMTSDLEYFEEMMQREKDAWSLRELNWVRESGNSKSDRVQRLEPWFRSGRFYLAQAVDGETSNQRKVREMGQAFRIWQPTKRRDHEGNLYALNKIFLDEYLVFPYSAHDDLIDAVSRIEDMEPVPPILIEEADLEPEAYADAA